MQNETFIVIEGEKLTGINKGKTIGGKKP